jgi:indolepyruvate ferredoxin oxidoreductase beta subunit
VAAGLEELSARSWRLEATAQAQKLGNPILGNIMMIGALSAVSDLPITPELFETAIGDMMPPAKVPVNLEAFELGRRAMNESRAGA